VDLPGMKKNMGIAWNKEEDGFVELTGISI